MALRYLEQLWRIFVKRRAVLKFYMIVKNGWFFFLNQSVDHIFLTKFFKLISFFRKSKELYLSP